MNDINPKPSEDQSIVDKSDLRKYRTELPNIYDDAELDVYEYRLLGHYKRVGTCTEGAGTTAKKCCMSIGKVSEVRQSLADKGFITLERVTMDAGRYRFIVRVIDRWIENFARYSGMSVDEIVMRLKKSSPSRGEASPSRGEASPSRGEGKKELVKKEPIKNLTTSGAIFSVYESEIGALTEKVADLLEDAMNIYPETWIVDAIGESVKNNKRNWKYCEAILKRWKIEGRGEKKKSSPVVADHAQTKKDIIRKVAENATRR